MRTGIRCGDRAPAAVDLATRQLSGIVLALLCVALAVPALACASDAAERKLDQALKEVERNEEKLGEVQQELEGYQRELQDATRALENAERTVDNLAERKEDVESRSAHRPGWRHAKANRRNELAGDIEEAEEKAKDLKKEIQKIESRIRSVEKKVERYEKYLDKAMNEAIEAQAAVKAERASATEAVIAAAEKAPDDAAANREAGVLLCFAQGKWSEGLPYLAKSDDPRLAALAKVELGNPTLPRAFIEIGKSWKAAADATAEPAHKKAMLGRAADWFRKVLPHLPEGKRGGFEKKIAALEAEAK